MYFIISRRKVYIKELRKNNNINEIGSLAIAYCIIYKVGMGEGGEVCVQWGKTKTLYSINLFDICDSIYEKWTNLNNTYGWQERKRTWNFTTCQNI